MKRLAIVDDDVILLTFLQSLFEERGYEVTVFSDSEEALQSLEDNCPDAVLSDVLMPKLSGFELCRKLRAAEAFGKVPIFLMSAKHSIGELSKSMMAGADEYIIKPFQPEELCLKLEQVYKRKNNPIRIKPNEG
ncbi:response regulator transcription factor [Paenibacillus sp. CC-CFT747]|nr:response regulator transcription factor [Paenibacillus sp. CC-CFT747]